MAALHGAYLHRDQTDATRRSMDKHLLHRLELRLHEAVVHSSPNDWKCDRLVKGNHWRQTTAHVTRSEQCRTDQPWW